MRMVSTSLKWTPLLALAISCSGVRQQAVTSTVSKEPHRPQFHFTPPAKWMNDPNGMVYHNGTWHLMYQHYPDSTVWGPMHWGHATSKDLVQWNHQPIALYPDSLGYIFSGSAVVDVNNTSGFGVNGKVPMVAIFTHHDPKGERTGSNTFQYQSLAYSLDDGKTWTKYAGNPVLKNPGIRDFRDPKVAWHESTKKWIMTLATLDRITFYSSPNLKDWTKESEFGKDIGAHGGVWECPDLFPLEHNGREVWVLLVSINPGGPNSGSATQYFTGQFDGHTFTPFQTDTRWIDYGPDNYAGVTWSNTGKRKVFMGWMSNWQYANVVPTANWRSAMTVPRDLGLQKIGEKYFLSSQPVPELNALQSAPITWSNLAGKDVQLRTKTEWLGGLARLDLRAAGRADFSVTLSNEQGQKVVIGFDKKVNGFYIDRAMSGNVDFEKGFAARHTAPRLATSENIDLTLLIDVASVELFADGGLSVMTQIFFPDQPFSRISIDTPEGAGMESVVYQKIKPIYPSGAAKH